MPNVFPGVGLESHDGAGEQILAALGTPVLLVPRSAVADTDVQEIKFGIVEDGIPNGAAATDLPPFTRPGLSRLRKNCLLERLRGTSGHVIKAPLQLARLRVIGGTITAHAKFAPAVADNHFALHDARRTGDGVAPLRVDRQLLPNQLAGSGLK